mgnify:CR=1 FL=1
MTQRYYITTAISYPNGAPHIGHAYEFICADAIARFKRLDGFDTLFQIGTDVHGQKMWQTARDLGISARELANRNSDEFQRMTDLFNISYDRFIRTSDEDHHRSSQAIWKAMAVLPVPVCASPITSRPAIACGIAFFWIGVGSVIPCSASFATRRG